MTIGLVVALFVTDAADNFDIFLLLILGHTIQATLAIWLLARLLG